MKFLLILLVIFYAKITNCGLHHIKENKKHGIEQKTEKLVLQIQPLGHETTVEDALKCPEGCLCQYAPFADLPISRWINHMQKRQPENNQGAKVQATQFQNDRKSPDYFYYNNEIDYNNVDTLMKQATCMVQETTDVVQLISKLPFDIQALILLYTGTASNKTVKSSAFSSLNQLTTLEIRGTPQRTLRFVLDKPLTFLQNANFESITLLGSENIKRPKATKHPRDTFDYKPSVYETYEIVNADENLPLHNKLDFAAPEENFDILPYDVYMAEVKRARMPSFYGWENLEVLRVHSCHLNELDWEMFDGLETLKHLSLERNGIETIPAFAFYGAMHIKTLSLAHNRIHSLHYRGLAGLLELEWLDLGNNELNNLSERSFPPFPKVQHIDFRSNPVLHIYPATFLVMNNTRKMLFSSKTNALELWNNMPFESLNKLEELIIENVSVLSLQQNILKDLHGLQVLKLHGKVQSIEFDAFADLDNLEILDMSFCEMRDISMDAFLGCKKLKIINMSNNNLTYIPPGLFDDQNFLEEIYLQRNQLRTLPMAFFLQPRLHIARLNDNPWMCGCDMMNWRPKVTNQERAPTVERCVKDFISGKMIACRQVDNYKIVRKHTPTCFNYQGRSVFYVLRKELKCNSHHVLYTQHTQALRKRIPLWRKLESRKRLYKQNQMVGNSAAVLNSENVNNLLKWRIKSAEKNQLAKAVEPNSLNWGLSLYSKNYPTRMLTHTDSGDEITNDI